MKTVLVTGALGALGSSVTERFISQGHHVLAAYHPLEVKNPDTLPRLQNCDWFSMDVTQSSSVRESISELRKKGHKIEGLVHCAGGFRFAHAETISDADLDFLIGTNFKSAFLLVRELLPEMKERNFGRLVFISSKATLNPPGGMSAYCASKIGLNALVASLAEEVKPFNINVNAILPSVIDTAANRKDMPKADFKAWVKPKELADIIHALVTDLGTPMNGALIPVSGRV